MFQFRILPVSLLALAAALGVPGTATAQPYPAYRVYPEPPRYQPRIPPHEVVAIVRSMGLAPTSSPRPRGPFWVVDAVGQEGSQVRVTLDGMNGRVNEIVRIPGPRLVRMHPGGPRPGDYYDGPLPGEYGPPRGPSMNEPRFYDNDDDDDDYPPQPRGPNYYGPGQRGSVQPMPSGPQVITRGGDVTNSIPQRQVSRGGGGDPLLGVPREFRGEQKQKTEQKKTAARPAEKTPTVTPTPKPRPADAPSVAKNESKPAAPSTTAPQAKSETQKPAAAPAKPSAPPVQGFE